MPNAQRLLLTLCCAVMGSLAARAQIATTTVSAGGFPLAVAVNPVTNKIYVANGDSNTMTVIDGASNSTTTVNAGTRPISVAVNPVTNKIYVANFNSANVTVIDGATNSTTTVNTGATPDSVAVNLVTNKIYVANYSGTVTVIDGATNSTTTVSAGTFPYSVAVNPVTNKIYVANNDSNNVTVIDGATNSTITVTAGNNAYSVAVNPVTNKIYVANHGSDNVTVIDGATNSPTLVNAGTRPSSVAVNPVTNKIYVTNYSSNNVTVIDGGTNSTTTVSVGTNPGSVAVNPVTNKIYVANNGSNNVTVIDGATNPTTTVSAGSSPVSVAANPVTKKIYVANFGSNNVTVIDEATNSTTTVSAGTHPYSVGVNPVTNRIYVANYSSNNVTVIDGATNSTTTLSVGTNPGSVAVNPVTNKIYVANGGSASVTVIDGATNSTTTVSAGSKPVWVAVNPVTNKIYVANYGSNNVTVIDGATNSTTTLSAGTNPNSVAANPVTNKIYVSNNGSSNMTVIDGASNTVTATVGVGAAPQSVAVNPVTNRIYVANAIGNSVTVIDGTTNSATDVSAGATPFSVAVNQVTNKIYVVNQGGTVTVIDGATNTPTTVNAGTSPYSVAVNAATNTIYIANDSSSNVTVIAGQEAQAIPLTTVITALAGNQSSSATPSFTFNAQSNFSPNHPTPANIFFQVDTWQGAWATGTGGANGSPFNGTVAAALQPGFHILYAYAGDGQEADSEQRGSPLIGSIAAYGFLVTPSAALSVTKTHSGNFMQGQVGATYTVTVFNGGNTGTSGTVTMTETAPTGLTVTAMGGTGWTCNTATCTRGDALAGGMGYPAITVTVNVAGNAGSSLLNQVSASGGGSATANTSDSTIITATGTPALSVTKTHSGNFTQGQVGAAYTVTVSNGGNAGTTGTVTVTEAAPSGLTVTSMAGTGWTCNTATCTRSDALAGGSSYSAITVTVNVAGNAGSPLLNQVSASGGGSATANASDSTIITSTIQPTLSVSRKTLNYGISGSLATSPQTILVTINGGVNVAWTVTSDHSNITAAPPSGVGTGTFQISASVGSSGIVTVTAPGAIGSPQTITVNVASVTPAIPIGSFDTPLNNTTGVVGAIPVTGWALDNIEVTHVDILREPVTGEPSGNLIFIGTAVFSADARPDVQAMFPAYPYSYRAGWGYQMLTNFLPNASGSGASGNGAYKLHAIAFNKAGSQLDLGTRTIVVDNAHAAKPFGTLDTPGQGGTISGADSVNFGWALTPTPANIATDGSTITVVIDGVPVGHPVYNNFRSDIANLFPGYANSMGAVGFYHVNTTTLANGVHTISWNVFDNLVRGEGLGSRYFNVVNTGGNVAAPEDVIPDVATAERVTLRHGLDATSQPDPIVQDADDGYSITMEEVGHIELHLGAASGHMLVQGEPHSLPTGSTLKGGVFYWQPGPGFLGEYTMQFERPDGSSIPVRVNIVPKRYSIQ
jgi:YVTN family beta-propeller protein